MASIYQLKSKFQGVLRPTVNKLAKMRVTANQVTLFACLLSVGTGFYFLFNSPTRKIYFWIPIFLFLRMALNAIDGMLAREHNMQSRLGAILNELTDVISDAFLYYPLGLLWGVHLHCVTLFVFTAILSEMIGVIAIQIGSTRRYDGPLGKSDRAFAFGLLSLLYAFNINITAWISPAFVLLILLEVLTIINRARKALGEIHT